MAAPQNLTVVEPALVAVVALLLVTATPVRALTVRFIPRTEEPAVSASTPSIVEGEIDLALGSGATESTTDVVSFVDGAPLSTPVESVAPTDLSTRTGSGSSSDSTTDGPLLTDTPTGEEVASPSGDYPARAQVPSAGAPAAGSPGIPVNGWGAGLPADAAARPGAFKASVRLQAQDWSIGGDPGRSVHDPGTALREDVCGSYERLGDSGVQLRAQSAMRYTDDREVTGDGNRFRLEGQFLEVGRPRDFLFRMADISGSFSPYSFARVGEGFQLIKNLEVPDGLYQLQVLGARTAREKDPGTFRRETTGVRAARVWRLGKNGPHIGLGAQKVLTRDDPSSISADGALATSGFPRDEVHSINGFFDSAQGVHAEAEFARSEGELLQAGNATAGARRGHAHRQSIGYTRSGSSLTLEHERIEPTFDAADAAAGVDMDRQSAFLNLALSPGLTMVAYHQRVYNDVTGTLGRTGDVRTSSLSVTASPFSKSTSGWLKNIGLGGARSITRTTATDATTNRRDSEWSWSVSNRIRRLVLSYQLRTAMNADHVAPENSRAPHHSSYQLSYEIQGGRASRWSVSPFVTLGHDRDRSILSGLVDRSSELCVGLSGAHGTRSNFTFKRDERTQRQVTATRQSWSEGWNGDFTYLLDPERELRANVAFSSLKNLDSDQMSLVEDRLSVSLFHSW